MLFFYLLLTVPLLLAKGIITQIYPLHDFSQLKALEHKWYIGIARKQPLGQFIL